MRRIDPLLIARENAGFHVGTALAAIAAGNYGGGARFVDAAFYYHLRGISSLLLDADREAFVANLCKAAQVDLHFRMLAESGVMLDRRFLRASMAMPFADALVAGDLGLAKDIARLAPARLADGFEYEDDFLRFHFLHLLLFEQADESPLERILESWETVLQGQGSAYLEVSWALLRRDPSRFEQALDGMIERYNDNLARFRRRPDYNEELDSTEGKVFMHGLAVLRMAELRGMETSHEYELMPSLARIPLQWPRPPAGAWRTG